MQDGYVNAWNDRRMPTLSGLRRRGSTRQRLFVLLLKLWVWLTKKVWLMLLYWNIICGKISTDSSCRVMGALDPLKVVITNYPEGQVEPLEAVNNPEDLAAGSRIVPFSRELYIERDDFMEEPPRQVLPTGAGQRSPPTLRLFHPNARKSNQRCKNGDIVELHCTYDPETKGGYAPDGRPV